MTQQTTVLTDRFERQLQRRQEERTVRPAQLTAWLRGLLGAKAVRH
ncbi:hypothetical protein [Streptomyces sp. NBC_01304]|nr:hypothetical protein OG430_11565 [Streptomyces sp. NBC_01304]